MTDEQRIAIDQFKQVHGPEWGRIVGSPAYGAAMKLAFDLSPMKAIAFAQNPQLLSEGHIMAAQMQGYQSAIVLLRDWLTSQPEKELPPPDYRPDDPE